MSLQGLLTTLVLPPISLLLVATAAGFVAWRGRRVGGLMVVLAMLGTLALATPFVAGWLIASLERDSLAAARAEAVETSPPAAIIILGADGTQGLAGPEVGPLGLERLRVGAGLHRRTGLPVLLTGGPLTPGHPPIAVLMAASLAADFGVAPRWIEPVARDTAENAAFSAAMLQASGVASAYLVTHGWHMARAREAFGRASFVVHAAPVRIDPVPDGRISDWVPRAECLGVSWYALREWTGRLVYAVRDGRQRGTTADP